MESFMGLSCRIYFIDEADRITRIPLTRFERIRDRDPEEKFSKYSGSRIRYVEIILELENRKPISINRIFYGYLQFDAEGKVDKDFLSREGQVIVNMMPSMSVQENPDNIIDASDKFAQKRFKNEFTWTPSFELEQIIIQKAFE
jgi:hypothetical protein